MRMEPAGGTGNPTVYTTADSVNSVLVYKQGGDGYSFAVTGDDGILNGKVDSGDEHADESANNDDDSLEKFIIIRQELNDTTVAKADLKDNRVEIGANSSDEGDIWELPLPRYDYICKICGKKFPKPLRFSKHLKTHLTDKLIVNFSAPPAADTDVVILPLDNIDETQADIKPDINYDINADINADIKPAEHLCSTCGQLYATSKKRHRCSLVYKCGVCGRSYSRFHTLRAHEQLHTGERSFQCSVCSKFFSSANNLRRHHLIHTGERPYACEYCDKRCSQKHELEQHRRVHTGERPYVCQVCGKAFAHRSYVRQHQLCHSNARPFECSTCGKRFTSTTGLRQHNISHIPRHLRPPVVRRGPRMAGLMKPGRPACGPSVCETCGKVFNYPAALRLHLRIHSGERPYRCEVCSKTFTQATHRLQHMRIHTGERPYGCSVCGKTFTCSGNRAQHELTHVTDKCYKCEVCEKTFAQPIYLSRHAKSHRADAMIVIEDVDVEVTV